MLKVEIILGIVASSNVRRARERSPVNAGHGLIVRRFGELVGQRGDGFQTIAPRQSAEEVSTQVESQRFQMDERSGAGEGTISSGPAISEETQPVARGQAQRLRASSLTDRNLQFEALQILKEAPPQIVFLPAG